MKGITKMQKSAGDDGSGGCIASNRYVATRTVMVMLCTLAEFCIGMDFPLK
jgi:hypothetical protein